MLHKNIQWKSEAKLIHGHNMGSKLNCHVEFRNTILFKKSLVNREIKNYTTE